ncbi:sensor histidine kinase [Cohnella boryungensis]|uniref:histidine kinase n=1 Tax=Cohnella boryungensis TaxID=768479 RepID=A0ABV8S7R3_9BACL
MSVKRRLALRLIAWLIPIGLILFALAALAMNWTLNQLNRIEAMRQFNSAGLYELVRTIQKEGDQVRFDPKLLELVKETGGWLQYINEEGRVTEEFFTPADVPKAYGPGQLTAYWLGKSPFPYELYLWIQEKDGAMHTLIYGIARETDAHVRQLAEEAVIRGREIVLGEKLSAGLLDSSSWVQLLDGRGREIASFNRPAGAPASYTAQQLALQSVYPDRYGTKLATYYDDTASRTWVISTPLPGVVPGETPALSPESRVIVTGIGVLLLSAILLFVLASLWFGQRFGSPIVHVLNWLRQLGEGRYEEPVTSGGVPRSQDRKGRRKRKYRVYHDVLNSMDTLSQTLHANEAMRIETERMREEWIAGVSHDLKTPLSSITGYAHLLNNREYEWSAEEIRSFSAVILEKSAYLDELLNDLALTYRLKNGQNAPSLEMLDLNEYASDAVMEAARHPAAPAGKVRFVPAASPVYVNSYRPWLKRIFDNLVANALLHNEAETVVTVSVTGSASGEVVLTFEDNGRGMDKETADRLFERYYRGTDTESRTEGSGLGMAVTKALVEKLGGTIAVDTALGKGTVIRLSWKSAPGSPA